MPRHLYRQLTAFFLLFLCGCSRAQTITTPSAQKLPSTPIPSALDDYVAREEPKYEWKVLKEESNAQGSTSLLEVTSQTWQGLDWKHRVEIVRPAKLDFPDAALIFNTFGGGTSGETLVAQLLARSLGATVINVFNIPNQPLWGMREDDLIAHTFQKFLETGDQTWPLLLPMTKGVIKAMDAAQEYSQKQYDQPLKRFVVSGASKRGWTSWLVAAADSKLHPNRVAGIIPLVYNNLNIPKQMPYQLESWGEYSPQIQDYTRRGLQAQMSTSRGQELVAIVDPYTYHERFSMPKLLINATNDPYWTPDATRFYLNDLPGPTSLYWAPNAGHDLGNDYVNVMASAAAWFRWVVSGKVIPTVNHSLRGIKNLVADSSAKPNKIYLWVALSNSRDLRNAKWVRFEYSVEAAAKGTGETTTAIGGPGPPASYMSTFYEFYFGDANQTLRLSTPIQIDKIHKR